MCGGSERTAQRNLLLEDDPHEHENERGDATADPNAPRHLERTRDVRLGRADLMEATDERGVVASKEEETVILPGEWRGKGGKGGWGGVGGG